MEKPLISVVITTYNRLDYLKEAVDSVKTQTFKNWELLVIDDASSDGTWDWLRELENERIRVFRQEKNSERSLARNRGLNEAKGEFIMFLDDDDRLRPNALTDLVKPLSTDSEIIAAVGARWKFKEGKEGAYAARIEHPRIGFKRVIWPELLAGWSSISGQNLYRKTVIRKLGGYRLDLNIGEDRELWFRVARLGKVAIIPPIVLEYRTHQGQWRPKNIVEVRENIFQECLDRLPAEERPRGKSIRESARCLQKADEEYKKGNYKVALNDYLKACQAAPKLAVSPITGPPLARGVAKSLVRSLLPKKP